VPKICYVPKTFRDSSLEIIERADRICREYAAMGYDLTLRQLYYQFVSRDWLPNSQQSYNRLGSIINDARLAGLIDWNHIVDRTRNLRTMPHWNTPSEIIEGASEGYALDKWKDQPHRVEVWIEKDALVGVLEAACDPMDVPFFSCRGYTSQSEVWGAAQRLRRHILRGQKVVILHLGDHDPSGVDMTRDIEDRLRLFIRTDLYQGRGKGPRFNSSEAVMLTRSHLEIRRIALNMEQVEQYDPPPNPAKFTDARYGKYVEEFGRECWELDALPPDVLVRLIQREVVSLRDEEKWAKMQAKEDTDKNLLKKVAKRWTDVVKLMAYLDKKAS
jgi:hypothetical protein